MSFAVGSLVRARGREWVVLPESAGDMLVLQPLGGTEDEVTGIHRALETVEPAQFDLPNPDKLGDYRSGRLLRDAVRLGFRSSAGPFRSFARIGVEPRPYQLVPLLMALKLDPVRVLIADDVGIGKTIEAGLIARELADRGEVERLAVLCPPQLAEQWQDELSQKFHLEAELVLPSTATRLERHCRMGQSLFEVYPHVVVSLDFIKSDRRRDEFARSCPELVIVDEAHTCAYGAEGRGGRHQRHQLVANLASNQTRHMILVTATPHSGNEEAFRSLLTLLNHDFADLPDDLAGRENERHRRRLAQHFVQRRRADIRHYMDADTPFPQRAERDDHYKLSPEYKRFFDRVIGYARESVQDQDDGRFRQRVRWWSALALLRSLASSPAAAAATLRNRASTADAETPEDADEIGRRTVLDIMDGESDEGIDVTPGIDTEDTQGETSQRRRLLELARVADSLMGDKDEKLKKAAQIIKGLVDEGFRPILFCRFIPTAEYVAEQLRARLPKNVTISAVTGTLPPAEREERVAQLDEAPKRVLVCTDCLSEGINLQEHFDAVLHYDLSWNPTRHEQREGRVDRYGQARKEVRVITYYGLDNQIDGLVLDVLIRKHRLIRSSLGVSVPVPEDTDRIIEAIFEGLLLREQSIAPAQSYLPGFEEFLKPKKDELFKEWDSASEREKRSRSVFAQETIKVDEVAREWRAAREAIGFGVEVASFVKEAFRAHNAVVAENGVVRFDLSETPIALRQAVGYHRPFEARFELPVQEGQQYLSRTHPVVEGLATYVMNTALDPLAEAVARRCGAIRTSLVTKRATVLLVRYRFHILTERQGGDQPLLAEDCQVLAFAGSPENAEWLDSETAENLLKWKPEDNIPPDIARSFLGKVIDGFEALRPHLNEQARCRSEQLLEAHRRVRAASRAAWATLRVEPHLPADVLGIHIYLPARVAR